MLGDACDPNPCASGEIENRPSGAAGFGTPVFAVDPTSVGPIRASDGFRFCPCALGSNDPASREDCERRASDRSAGCVRAAPALYASTLASERTDWRIPTLLGDGITAGGEIELDHDLPVVTRFEGFWEVSRVDRPRWSSGRFLNMYPSEFASVRPTDPTRPIYGVGWFHTLIGTTRLLTNHYTSGAVTPTRPDGLPVPLPAADGPMMSIMPLPFENEWCPYCGDWLPVPWLVMPCLADGCEDTDQAGVEVALEDRLVVAAQPTFAPLGFGFLAEVEGARWTAASEPRGLVPPGALRFAALDASTGLPRRLLAIEGGAIVGFGKSGQIKTWKSFDAAAALAGPVVTTGPRGELRPPRRSGFAMAASARHSCAWMAGGVDPRGARLHDIWRYAAVSGDWRPLEVRSATLGNVLAIAYAPLEGALYLLDETDDPRHSSVRLLRLPPEGGDAVVEGTWPRFTRDGVTALLAADGDGNVWLAASVGRSGRHAVARLSRDRRGELRPSGFAQGDGTLQPDGAFAAAVGLSLAVGVGDPERLRIVGYGADDLVPRGGFDRWF